MCIYIYIHVYMHIHIYIYIYTHRQIGDAETSRQGSIGSEGGEFVRENKSVSLLVTVIIIILCNSY